MKEYLMYLRKSRQDNANETVEQVLQRHYNILFDTALKLGETIPESNIYREIVSGETIDDRPQIQAVFRRLERGNVAGVLVVDPQRLTRGDLLDCGTVVHIFRYTNTKIITPTKTYDLSDKYDRRFFEMELSRGNDYLEYTKEVLVRGRRQSVREGNYIGSVAPYGYNRVKIGKSWTLEINEDEAQYVRLMFQLYVQGVGYTSIGTQIEALGAKPRNAKHFDRANISAMLQNPIYVGKVKLGYKPLEKVLVDGRVVKKRPRKREYELIDGKHPAIVSDDLFNQAQAKRGSHTKEKQKTELANPFAHVLKCRKCGKAIAIQTYKDRRSRYHCKDSKYCGNISCDAELLNNAIYDALLAHLEDFKIKLEANNDDAQNARQSLVKSLKQKLANVESRQNELYDLLENRVYSVSVFNERNAKLAEERKTIQQALENAQNSLETGHTTQEKYTTLHYALTALKDDKIPAKAKNNLIQAIVDKIYYLKDENGIDIEVILK